jgi:hypothetical protein
MKTLKVMPMPMMANGLTADSEKAAKENNGGVGIFIGTDSYDKKEFARVAYIRRTSKNKKVPFKEQLDKTLADADALVKVLNERLAEEVPEVEDQIRKLTEEAQAEAERIKAQVSELTSRLDSLTTDIINQAMPSSDGSPV